MSNRWLGGKPPVGTQGGYVPFVHKNTRPPTVYDWQGYFLFDEWEDIETQLVWKLVSLDGNSSSAGSQATWVLMTGPNGAVLGLTGNSGGEVFPLNGNINVVGDGVTANVVGNPLTNTLTISAVVPGGNVYTVQTTNNTPTTIFSQALTTSQAIVLEGIVVAAKSNYSAALVGRINGGARRVAGGAILVGTPVVEYSQDSGTGLPTIDIVVSGNNVIIQVTGETGVTYNWKVAVDMDTV